MNGVGISYILVSSYAYGSVTYMRETRELPDAVLHLFHNGEGSSGWESLSIPSLVDGTEKELGQPR
jgi:hypothetical protein